MHDRLPRRTATLISCAVLVLVWALALAPRSLASPPSAIPLFQSREILSVELVADFDHINSHRETVKTPGLFRISDGGKVHEFEMLASPRGHYKHLTCNFEPLMLTLLPTLDSLEQALADTALATSDRATLTRLRAEGAAAEPPNELLANAFTTAIAATFKGTPLENSGNHLVFATHCSMAKDKARQAFLDSRVIEEQALYEVVDATDVLPTLKIRLLDATYREPDGTILTTGKAFIVEHKDDLARRLSCDAALILEDDDAASRQAQAQYDVEPLKGKIPFYFANQMIVNNDFKYLGHNGMIMTQNGAGIMMVPYDFDLSALVGGLGYGPHWQPKSTDDRVWFQLLAKKDPHYWSSKGVAGPVGDKVAARGRRELAANAAEWRAATYETARALLAHRDHVLEVARTSYLDAGDKKRLEQRLTIFFDALAAELADKR